MADDLGTERLLLRRWRPDDAADALAIYGTEPVTRWLAPARSPVPDLETMQRLVDEWSREELDPPQARWAVERRSDGRVIGSLILRFMPPHDEDVEIAWQLAPDTWGQGYATEAARAVAKWALDVGAGEIFAVVRPANTRGIAMARRLGMEWVGETAKYYHLTLQVFRLRRTDLVP